MIAFIFMTQICTMVLLVANLGIRNLEFMAWQPIDNSSVVKKEIYYAGHIYTSSVDLFIARWVTMPEGPVENTVT